MCDKEQQIFSVILNALHSIFTQLLESEVQSLLDKRIEIVLFMVFP
jgi:hypothetical protein